jgi:hypothetical protein
MNVDLYGHSNVVDESTDKTENIRTIEIKHKLTKTNNTTWNSLFPELSTLFDNNSLSLISYFKIDTDSNFSANTGRNGVGFTDGQSVVKSGRVLIVNSVTGFVYKEFLLRQANNSVSLGNSFSDGFRERALVFQLSNIEESSWFGISTGPRLQQIQFRWVAKLTAGVYNSFYEALTADYNNSSPTNNSGVEIIFNSTSPPEPFTFVQKGTTSKREFKTFDFPSTQNYYNFTTGYNLVSRKDNNKSLEKILFGPGQQTTLETCGPGDSPWTVEIVVLH